MSYLTAVVQHLDWFVERATVQGYGPDDNSMWMSSLDLRTGRSPEPWDRPDGIEARCYRWIESPGGSNAYWDAPLMAAARRVSERTGEARYAEAADRYVRDFLDRCVVDNGLFLWGNHYYYDAARGETVWFTGGSPPEPIDPETEVGVYHETRPLSVPWDLFWEVDPVATEKSIRSQGELHVVDTETGEHNRHADRTRGHAFLESGAILAESLCWLANRTNDRTLVDLAKRIGAFNYGHRDATTGLMSNSPTKDRWDMHMTTSEVGFWAGTMLTCGELSDDDAFSKMAASSLAPWLDRAWDSSVGRFYGKLAIRDGRPVLGEKTTRYQPGDVCDPWEPLFPAHDYPIQCADACLRCYERTDDEAFRVGVERWVGVIERSLPARDGVGGYAEHYGRCITFLRAASERMGRPEWASLADRVSAEAMGVLWTEGRFRTHPGEDRCDAVDGFGFLVEALVP